MGCDVYRTKFNGKDKYFSYKPGCLRYAEYDLYTLVCSAEASQTFDEEFTKDNYSKYYHLFPWEFLE